MVEAEESANRKVIYMKKLGLIAVSCAMLLSGCSLFEKDEIAPELSLTKKRIIVDLNSDIDYLSYVEKAEDETDGDLKGKVTYNSIETNKKGYQEITYTVEDDSGNSTSKKLGVNVVKMFEGGVYSPEDVEAKPVDDPEDITVLINKLHSIPKGWEPDDLEPSIDNPGQMLRKEANEAYTRFYKDAKAKGIAIYSISGYRKSATQDLYWNNQVRVHGVEYASQYSAYPDRSEHQLGLTMDVSYKTTGDRLSESVETSEIGQFIVHHAHEYGFILRYPKDKVAITNYGYEPWHIRYVGVDLATKLHESGLTLDEYYGE